MGPKFSHATVAKAVKCDMTTVKCWLKRWEQSEDLSDPIQSSRVQATTHEQDEQTVSHAQQQAFVTAPNMVNKLRKTGATANERTIIQRRLNEAAAEYNQTLSKPLRLSRCIEKLV